MGLACRICGNSEGNKPHAAFEMQFGTREEFTYVECGKCGCLQIKDIPVDMSRYYPRDYYSFTQTKKRLSNKAGTLRSARTKWFLGGGGFVGAVAGVFVPVSETLEVAKKAGLKITSAIIDVGSGSGTSFLSKLKKEGFERLEGADPYIEKDTRTQDGIVIFKKSIDELRGPYDAVFMNHSFEHVLDPEAELKGVRRILGDGACAVITIPVAGTYAWKHYGKDWVGLDAPRHVHLHTPQSMELLAKKAGFRMENNEYLSDPAQIWASEQYRRGVPLIDNRSYFGKKAEEYFSSDNALFSRVEMEGFRNLDEKLVRENDSDVVRFYMRAV